MTTRRPLVPTLVLALVLGLCAAAAPARAVREQVVPLDALTVAVGAGGRLVEVQDAAELLPGSRVLAGTPDSARQHEDEQAWLAAGTVPSVPGLGGSTMVRDALLDLRALSLPTGVATAGWSRPWRYVWPRDSALAAVALARTGHLADAQRVLDLLQQVQPPSGIFQARYRPDGSGVPDDRGPQLDGVGWALWATAEVAATVPADQRAAFLGLYRRLLDRSTAAALGSVGDRRALPPVSMDYWERREHRPTLATAALVLVGLESAARLYEELAGPGPGGDTEPGRPDRARADQARQAALRLQGAVAAGFGADGYPRYPGGAASSVDLGAAFLLPPFRSTADPGVVAAWRRGPTWMLRPAGGLAPGGSWRDDGISWSTATSSYALTAAALGDRDAALHWLGWLDAHRTSAGSLPEKVLSDGSPAAVAPLSWAAAAVVLSADELDPVRR